MSVTAQVQPRDVVLTVQEAAELAKTCCNTIKAAILAGALKATNVGLGRRRYWRISRCELRRWLGIE